MLNPNDINAESSGLVIDGGIMLSSLRGTDSVADAGFVASGESRIVASGVSVNECTVLDGGEMRIESGATARGLVVSSGGTLWIEAGCGVSGLVIKSGARVNGFRLSKDCEPASFSSKSSKGLVLGKVYVDSGYDAVLGSGQGVDECRVLAGGSLDFHQGAFAEMSLIVSSGGRINGFTAVGMQRFAANVGDGQGVAPLAELEGFKTYSSGRVRRIFEIASGGVAYLYSGQSLLNCVVPEGGRLEIADGALIEGVFNLTGSLVLADGAVAKDLTVNVIIDSLEQVNAEPIMMTGDKTPEAFSVTVGKYQVAGVYLLANGLGNDYNCSVRFNDADGAELALLSLDSDAGFDYEYGTYSLSMSDGALALTVSPEDPESDPVLTVFMSNDGKLHVNGTDEVALRSVKYRFDGDGEWERLSDGAIDVPEGAAMANLRCINCAGQEKVISFGIDGILDGEGNDCVAPFGLAFGPDDREFDVTVVSEGARHSFSSEDGRLSIYSRQVGISVMAKDMEGNGYLGEGIVLPDASLDDRPMSFEAGSEDGLKDVFLATPAGTWDENYVAFHAGFRRADATVVGATDAMASIVGRNRIHDIFSGAEGDSCIVLLTDDENGDAVFVDDVFSNSPNGVGVTQARLANIDEIFAGAGNDVIDLTSDQFSYLGAGMTIHGGLGDDVIWANLGSNCLFGDAGDDWIVGASDDDVMVGGPGRDTLNGNGGEDTFCFGPGWGEDKVQQRSDGKAILWFAEGLDVIQDGRRFTCGDNVVSLCDGVDFEVRIGSGLDGTHAQRYAYLCALGAFG
ncbi:MAG: hypothetical protein IJS15_16955 [Victivallales bacterium]|nr:hypothetical protein [Victivallales bacterium]